MAAHRNRVKASFRNDAANKILEELRLKWQSANCNAYYLRIKWGISTVDLGQILSAFFISPYADFSSHSTGCRRSTPSGAVNSILFPCSLAQSFTLWTFDRFSCLLQTDQCDSLRERPSSAFNFENIAQAGTIAQVTSLPDKACTKFPASVGGRAAVVLASLLF